MVTKADFTEADWQKVKWAPHWAAAGAMIADPGLVSLLKESAAILKALEQAEQKYATNALIKTVAQELSKDLDAGKDAFEPADEQSTEQRVAKLLSSVSEASAAVARRATALESSEYRGFVYELAEVAANASGEGFFGTGQKVSSLEKKYLAQLKSKLGIQ